MKNLLKDRQDRKYVAIIVVVNIITHLKWLFDFRVFTSGDWWYIGLQRYMDWRHFSPIWVTDGLGSTSAVPPFYFIRYLEGLMTYVGSSFALNEKIFFFLPIIFVGSLGSYLFARQYFKPPLAFIGSIIFSFNTALLFDYAGALTIGVAYALTPVVLFVFQRYLKQPRNYKLLVATALGLALMAAYEQRICLLVIAMMGGLFVFNSFMQGWSYCKERVIPFVMILGLFGLLHAFWLVPYVVNARAGVTFSDLLSQQLFESFSTIQNALTLYHPFWTGARPATFVLQSIPWYAWILPIMAFGGLAIRADSKTQVPKELYYWAFVAAAGLLLVKQVNEPFINVYPWIFSHVPGFSAFREASKFYLFIIMGYSVLVPFTLACLYNWTFLHADRKKIFIWPKPRVALAVGSVVVLALFAFNTIPLITGTFKTLYSARTMPADYVKLEKFVAKQPQYFRLLWVPTNSRWGIQSNQHPSVRSVQVDQGAWLSQLGRSSDDPFATLRDKSTGVVSSETSGELLDKMSAKYVIVPIRDTANEDDFFRYYGDDRQYYINMLDQQSYLKKIDIGTKDLVVYENMNFKPYIAAATTVQSADIDKTNAITPYYTFVTNTLHQAFNFVAKNSKTGAHMPTTQTADVFQNLRPKEVSNGVVSKTYSTMQNPSLFISAANREVRYEIKENTIYFYGKQQDGLTVNQKAVLPNQDETLLASAPFDNSQTHYLSIGSASSAITPSPATKDLGLVKDSLALYTVSGKDQMTNSSFEQDLWQHTVSDCNNYDNKGDISMEKAKRYDATGHALEFQATRHTACTDSAAITAVAQSYAVSFDYSIMGGETIGYEVLFNNGQKVQNNIDVQGQGWKTYQKIVDVPNGATSFKIRLLGFPDYRLRGTAVTSYDNVHVVPLQKVAAIAKTDSSFQQIALPKDQSNVISYAAKTNAAQGNLIANGSFDNGLWQRKVADCDNYDANPKIAMGLVSHDAGKALELSAQLHAACTSRAQIPVQEMQNYLFSFDYQSPNAKSAYYSLSFNDANKTVVNGTVPIKNTKWQSFSKQIQAPIGATKVSVTLYAFTNNAGLKKMINRYDNVSLLQIPQAENGYYIVDTQQSLAQPKKITFTNLSATKKSVSISGATTPFYVTMAESYNPLWTLSHVANTNHFKLDDFSNGWYVDPQAVCNNATKDCHRNADGSYDMTMTINFAPQHWFYVGSWISGITLLACLIYVYRVRGQQQAEPREQKTRRVLKYSSLIMKRRK